MRPPRDGGVLTITFDRKVDIDPAAIAQRSAALYRQRPRRCRRQDLPLRAGADARLHTSVIGRSRSRSIWRRDSFTGRHARSSAAAANRSPSRSMSPSSPRSSCASGAYSNFTRLVFDWPRNVPYTVFPGAGHLTMRFEALARPDFSAHRARLAALGEERRLAHRRQRHRHRVRDRCRFRLSRFQGRHPCRARHPCAQDRRRGLYAARNRQREQSRRQETAGDGVSPAQAQAIADTAATAERASRRSPTPRQPATTRKAGRPSKRRRGTKNSRRNKARAKRGRDDSAIRPTPATHAPPTPMRR